MSLQVTITILILTSANELCFMNIFTTLVPFCNFKLQFLQLQLLQLQSHIQSNFYKLNQHNSEKKLQLTENSSF